jgi:NAD(P)-dependent dehydrogenase (short-subunit alcohol dehydrogenase family)
MKTGRIVVVTGAAGGMGALIVRRFLANGDSVIGTDTEETALARLRDAEGRVGKLLTLVTDVSKEEDCYRLAAFARKELGKVDLLVNCAGFFPVRAFEEITAAEWRKVIDVNLTGVFFMTKAILPLMKGRGWGRIINVGSASTYEGVAEQVHYVSAKAGVVGFMRSVARAVGGDGITVNTMTPGLTVTPRVKETMPKALLEEQIKARAIKREEVPEDLVGSIFFLASPDADFISGQTLNVDGGKHMG